MANPRLEKHILAIAAVLLAVGVIVMLIWNLGRLFSVLGLAAGYVLSAANFLSTSFLYGSMDPQREGRTRLPSVLLLIASFAATVLVLFFAYRFSHLFFWCAVAGVLMVPLAVILFIIAEAAGIIHTDYYV